MAMVEVLVIGKTGQLAQCLAKAAPHFPDIDLHFLDRASCDLECPEKVGTLIHDINPDMVLNAAAYTKVDQAENEPEKARKINCEAVRVMGEMTMRLSIPLVHFSTDYVFDGAGSAAFREDDPVAPLGVYGATKLCGENALRDIAGKHLIFRTSWVYSPYGANFVKTMLRLMIRNDEIRVVNDQVGCPTSAQSLADAVLGVVPKMLQSDFSGWGTYHLVSGDAMTWHDFACAIQSQAVAIFGIDWPGANCQITPISSREFPTVAQRPAYSVLSTKKFEQFFGFSLPAIKSSLNATLAELARGEFHA